MRSIKNITLGLATVGVMFLSGVPVIIWILFPLPLFQKRQ